MSTPPPGSPPTPQPPPTYPPYPPQGGYPPPYPQQPYYTQPVPPKKDNTVLLIVVVVVVVVVALALIAWYAITVIMAPITSSQVTVTGVSFSVNYPGSFPYFGGPDITTCGTCPIHVNIMAQFTYTLSLHNVDTVDHNVTDVTVTGPNFSLVSASPNPSTLNPVVVAAGSTRSIVLTIQPTTFSGSYTLTGTITTT